MDLELSDEQRWLDESINTLLENSFKVFDEGKPVKIAKFEHVKNLPLSLGMAFDTSGSMLPRIAEAQKAGANFFKNVLKPGDKAFLVSFSSQAQLIQKWSPKMADMNAGLFVCLGSKAPV